MTILKERICDGVEWEHIPDDYGDTIFNPASEDLLDSIGLGSPVRRGDTQFLRQFHCGSKIGRGAYGSVYEVRDHPETLIKISERGTGIHEARVNIALSQALRGPMYDTPAYYAYMSMPSGDSMTIMSRSPRRDINSFLADQGKRWTVAERSVLWEHMRGVGNVALEGVGFTMSSIEWDLHPGNLLADACPDSPEAACQVPLTVIDQQSRFHSARPWDNPARVR